MVDTPSFPTRRAVVAGVPIALGLAAADPPVAGSPSIDPARLMRMRTQAMMSAVDFGITGRDDVDETRPVQLFLDACAQSGGHVAHFGTMRIRISGPLFARSVGIVFDRQSYGVTDPGFYATGSGYTALTVTGLIPDFDVTIYGHGEALFDADGRITSDTRPRVNGFQFGAPDESDPLIASVVRHARAYKLSGFGIRHTTCFDTSFLAESSEECGNEDAYAFEVAGTPTNNCNESVWLRVQVELSANRAMLIHTNTLSCVFVKIHSERATATKDVLTWQFGGACEFGSARLNAHNPRHASVRVSSAQADCRNFRVEGDIPVVVNATYGVVTFHNSILTMAPDPSQNGQIDVIGGQVRALGIGAGWTFLGTRLDLLEIGFMPPATSSTAIGCTIQQMGPQSGASQGEMVLQSCRAVGRVATADGRIRHLLLVGGTRFVSADPILSVADEVTVDDSAVVAGSVKVQGGGLRLHGRIEGDLSVQGPHRCLAGQGAIVTGRVTGWTPPTASAGAPLPDGSYCKNLAPVRRTSPRGLQVVTGWTRVEGQWLEVTLPG